MCFLVFHTDKFHLILSFLLIGGFCHIDVALTDVKGTENKIKFDVNSDGSHDMILNVTGLGIGQITPSANLEVAGNAIVTQNISIGGESSQSNLNLQGTLGYGFASISSNTSLDDYSYYLVDSGTAGANINLTLPNPTEVIGRELTIKKVSSLYDVNVLGLIEEGEKITMSNTQGNGLPYLSLISDGDQWYITNQSDENNSETVASSNLIHHWKFEDSTGSTATDSVGNSAPGAMTSMSFENNRVTGKVGYGLEFDGSADSITVGDLDDVELTSLTIAFWAKVNSLTEDHDFVVKGNHTTGQPLLIWFDDSVGSPADVGDFNTNTVSVLTYDGATQHWVAAPSEILGNTDWNHIAVVINPNTGDLSIYVNGEIEVTNNLAWNGIEASADQVRLGTDVDDTYVLDGSMDDVRIYNKVLSASEIRDLYQLGAQ